MQAARQRESYGHQTPPAGAAASAPVSSDMIATTIQNISRKIEHGGAARLAEIQNDMAALTRQLERQSAPSQRVAGPRTNQAGYKSLESSLSKIASNVASGEEAEAKALRALQARLAQISARAGSFNSPAHDSADDIRQLSYRIGDLTRRAEHASKEARARPAQPRTTPPRDHVAPSSLPAADGSGLASLQQTLDKISAQLTTPSAPAGPMPGEVDAELARLVREAANAPAPNRTGEQITDLEERINALDAMLTQMQGANDNHGLAHDFHHQIGMITERLAETERKYDDLRSIEHTMAQLLSALNQEQAESAPDHAAQNEALSNLTRQLGQLNANAQQNDQRTQSALTAMHGVLETLTTRLNQMEQRPQPPARPQANATPPSGAPKATSPRETAEPAAKTPKRTQNNPVEQTKAALASALAERLDIKPPASGDEPAPAPLQSYPMTPDANPAARVREDFIAAARQSAQESQPSGQPGDHAVQTQWPASLDMASAGNPHHLDAHATGISLSERKPKLMAAAAMVAICLVTGYGLISWDGSSWLNAPAQQSRTAATKPAQIAAAPANPAPSAMPNASASPPINTPKSAPAQPAKASPASPAVAAKTPGTQPPKPNMAPPAAAQLNPFDGPTFNTAKYGTPWTATPLTQPGQATNTPDTAPPSQPIVTGSLPAAKAAPQAPSTATPQTKPATPQVQPVKGPLPPAEIGPHALRISAAAGNAAAQFEIASRFAEGKVITQDFAKAAAWYQKAAAKGLASAQYRLGTLYEKGRGVPLDKTSARIWYERAAEKGNVKAMHNLAVIYANGGQGKRNFARAAIWFRKAAELGLADSQYNLGILSERGLGTRKNVIEAYKWFAIAARNGDQEASSRKAVLEQTLAGQDLVKARLAAQTWQAAPMVTIANKVTAPKGGWKNLDRAAKPAPGPAAQPALGREAIIETQKLLNQIGYTAGPADGVLGAQTREAIREFQSGNAMKVTGAVSTALLDKLRIAAN